MQTLSLADIRRQLDTREWIDDDLPHQPEVCPLSSAQSRRAARDEPLQAVHSLTMHEGIGLNCPHP